jgi:molecular chaperone GrpE
MADATAEHEQEQDQAPVDAQPREGELLSLLQRERADFQNYRRRALQERAEERDRVRADVLVNLLPLLDDLDRALAQAPEDLTDNQWARGVLLSRQRLLDFLSRSDVERFGAEGEPFDPARHEALFYEELPEVTEPKVGSIIRPGYRVGQRILRPAQVGVIGPSEHATAENATGPDGEDRVVETRDERQRGEA